MTVTPLEPTALFTPCSDDDLAFETTAALESLQAVPGQGRAVEALEVGIGIRHRVVVRAVTPAKGAVARAIQSEKPALCVVACQSESAELGQWLTDRLWRSVLLVK